MRDEHLLPAWLGFRVALTDGVDFVTRHVAAWDEHGKPLVVDPQRQGLISTDRAAIGMRTAESTWRFECLLEPGEELDAATKRRTWEAEACALLSPLLERLRRLDNLGKDSPAPPAAIARWRREVDRRTIP